MALRWQSKSSITLGLATVPSQGSTVDFVWVRLSKYHVAVDSRFGSNTISTRSKSLMAFTLSKLNETSTHLPVSAMGRLISLGPSTTLTSFIVMDLAPAGAHTCKLTCGKVARVKLVGKRAFKPPSLDVPLVNEPTLAVVLAPVLSGLLIPPLNLPKTASAPSDSQVCLGLGSKSSRVTLPCGSRRRSSR